MFVWGEGLSRISCLLCEFSSFPVYFKIPTLLISDKLYISCSNVLIFISIVVVSMLIFLSPSKYMKIVFHIGLCGSHKKYQ